MPLFHDGDCPPLERWSEPAQVALFAACGLAVNLALGYMIAPLQFTDAIDVQSDMVHSFGTIGAGLRIIAAPFVETLIGQWLPMYLIRLLKKPPVVQILAASLWFAMLHLPNGPASVVQTFGVGWVFASCFLFCRRTSFIKAYRVTSFAHALHNGIVFLMFLMLVD